MLLECDPETPPQGGQGTQGYMQLMHALGGAVRLGWAGVGMVVARVMCQFAQVQPLLIAGGVVEVCGVVVVYRCLCCARWCLLCLYLVVLIVPTYTTAFFVPAYIITSRPVFTQAQPLSTQAQPIMQALLSLLTSPNHDAASYVCDTVYSLSTVPPGQRNGMFQVCGMF